MGIGALVILIVSKKLIPKFPMAIVIMIAGVLSTIVFHVNQYGVVLLQAVQPGLPRLIFPDFTGINLTQACGKSTYGRCCDHGRDTFVREQFCIQKRI